MFHIVTTQPDNPGTVFLEYREHFTGDLDGALKRAAELRPSVPGDCGAALVFEAEHTAPEQVAADMRACCRCGGVAWNMMAYYLRYRFVGGVYE